MVIWAKIWTVKKIYLAAVAILEKIENQKNILFSYYMQNQRIKQKFYCFFQVFFLCFYRLVTGKGSIYGGMFTFTEKPPEPETLVCVHFHSQPFQKYSFSHNPYNPSIIGSYRKSTLNGINPQLLGVWNKNRTSPKMTFWVSRPSIIGGLQVKFSVYRKHI